MTDTNLDQNTMVERIQKLIARSFNYESKIPLTQTDLLDYAYALKHDDDPKSLEILERLEREGKIV